MTPGAEQQTYCIHQVSFGIGDLMGWVWFNEPPTGPTHWEFQTGLVEVQLENWHYSQSSAPIEMHS